LAITYGLMGVINMAHGELMMIGAYATYSVQVLFRHHAPAWFDAYLLVAVPVAFLTSALVGAALERLVLRHLYGRPLETLLATWGISLMLMQGIRSLYGAQNVGVENPDWMSGGWQVLANLTLPWNRIIIIAFAALVLLGMTVLIGKTRLGLFVRGVTQNRAMASALGVHTTNFLAIIGAASLAVGLALKDSLSNFSSGVMLVVFRPFKVGDQIEAAGVGGVVDAIGMYNVTLKTPDNRVITVPNSLVYSGTITNYNAEPRRRIDLLIPIGYDADIPQAKRDRDDIGARIGQLQRRCVAKGVDRYRRGVSRLRALLARDLEHRV